MPPISNQPYPRRAAYPHRSTNCGEYRPPPPGSSATGNASPATIHRGSKWAVLRTDGTRLPAKWMTAAIHGYGQSCCTATPSGRTDEYAVTKYAGLPAPIAEMLGVNANASVGMSSDQDSCADEQRMNRQDGMIRGNRSTPTNLSASRPDVQSLNSRSTSDSYDTNPPRTFRFRGGLVGR